MSDDIESKANFKMASEGFILYLIICILMIITMFALAYIGRVNL
jgi:hypothetical protein